MTTLENGNRRISVELGNVKEELKTHTIKEKTYTITPPTIICNNEEDAATIESEVSAYVSDLVKKILYKED